MTNLAPLKSNLPGKFQRFNAIVWSIKKKKVEKVKMRKNVKFPKISIKVKNCKTFYEAQTASCLKEIIQPPLSPLPTR